MSSVDKLPETDPSVFNNNEGNVASEEMANRSSPTTDKKEAPTGGVTNNNNNAPDAEDHNQQPPHEQSPIATTAIINVDGDVVHEPINGNGDSDDESRRGEDSDAESMESDYYYDDEGKMHTYYRPKRHLSSNSKKAGGKRSSARSSVRPTPRSTSSKKPADAESLRTADGRSKTNSSLTKGKDEEGTNAANEDTESRTSSLGATNNSMTSSMRNGSFGQLPANLRGIGKQIHKLSTEELLYISAIVGRKAHREAYSVLQYSGGAWYLPNIRKCREGEKEWGVDYNWTSGLVLSIGGKHMEIPLLSYAIRATLLVLLWFIVYYALPHKLSQRAGYIFDPVVTLLVCAVVGGFICRILQIPPLVGCLWIGILWNNIGPEVGYLTKGIYKDVRTISGRFGITVVLLRAGFSISWKTVRPILPNVGALILGAYGFESTIHGFFANFMFDYNDYRWSFLQGCLCSAPSAAVVVPGSLLLQSEGYSKTKGPLPVMLAAVGIETVLSVWVVSFIIDFMFGTMSVGLSSALGPIQIIGGIALGILLAFIFHLFVKLFRMEANRLPTGKYAETHLATVNRNALITFLLIAHGVIFFGYYQNLAGGAAVTIMFLACTVSNFWMYGEDPEWMEHKKELGSNLCDVWDLFVMPFLFSMTGSKIVAAKIFNKTFFPKALACWVVSNAARMFAVGFSPLGLGFSWKEWIFMMPGYCAKATVQSALASAALDKVTKRIASEGRTPGNVLDLQRATDVQNMAIFYVMWSAPAAAIWVTKMGPRLLKKEQ